MYSIPPYIRTTYSYTVYLTVSVHYDMYRLEATETDAQAREYSFPKA